MKYQLYLLKTFMVLYGTGNLLGVLWFSATLSQIVILLSVFVGLGELFVALISINTIKNNNNKFVNLLIVCIGFVFVIMYMLLNQGFGVDFGAVIFRTLEVIMLVLFIVVIKIAIKGNEAALED